MVDANLHLELVGRYQIQRVPPTVVNRDKAIPGGKTMTDDCLAGQVLITPAKTSPERFCLLPAGFFGNYRKLPGQFL